MRSDPVKIPSACLPSISGFIETDYIKGITTRALGYIKAGFPLHFRGISGTGKTSLAIDIAAKLGRPLMLIHSHDLFSSGNIAGMPGYLPRNTHTVFVPASSGTIHQRDRNRLENSLSVACRYGYTLVYDEFPRSTQDRKTIRALLPILQEKYPGTLAVPFYHHRKGNIHKNFTAIFTSNPETHANIYGICDTLTKKMLTLDLDFFDKETETCIVKNASGLDPMDAERIVTLVRKLRASGVSESPPTVRAGMKIAKTVKELNRQVSRNDVYFIQICLDILSSETSRLGNRSNKTNIRQALIGLIERYCGPLPDTGSRCRATYLAG